MFTLEFLEFLAHPAGKKVKEQKKTAVYCWISKVKNNCQQFYCKNLSITGSYGFFLVTKCTAKKLHLVTFKQKLLCPLIYSFLVFGLFGSITKFFKSVIRTINIKPRTFPPSFCNFFLDLNSNCICLHSNK